MKPCYGITREKSRWALVDPDGRRFYSLGVDCVTSTDVYIGNLIGKYGGGGDWFERWSRDKLSFITSLGFNTLGSWHHMIYWGNGFPKTVELSLSRHASKVNVNWGVGFPDVFDESFVTSIHKVLIDCCFGKGSLLKEDRGMMGFFTDNELHWWGSSGFWGCNNPGAQSAVTGLVDDYIELSEDKAGKKAWVNFLENRYGTIDSLNTRWGSEYSEFSDLLYIARYKAKEEAIEADKTDFLAVIAETYFETTGSILKEYFPDTLNLGCRFVGATTPRVVLEAMKKHVDIVSVNFYESMEVIRDYLVYLHEVTGLPVMVTEFSFCAGREAGFLHNTNGARSVLVKNQKRRGECYREFAEAAFELPFVVGSHWFALYDFSNNVHGLTGNYGLLDLKDRPWEGFVETVKEVNLKLAGRL